MWRCPSRAVLLSHFVVLVLTVSWLTLTGFQVAEYMSEPTATRVIWNSSVYLPPVTVCPAIRLPHSFSDDSSVLTNSATLLELFDQHGIPPEDIFVDYDASTERPLEICDSAADCLMFKKSFDYQSGGICYTSEASSGDMFELALEPASLYGSEQADYTLTYDLILHGQQDFVGDVFMDEPTYYLSSAQRGLQIIITTHRQISPNLKRDPCEDDLNYSKRLCERQCFFNWLNCSLVDDADHGRPRCMAGDILWYEYAGALDTFYKASDGVSTCQCPKQCVTDLITVSITPDFYIKDNNYTYVGLEPARSMQVLETYVTYTLTDLLADMGGFLGLLLGSSLLSVLELLPQITRWARAKVGTRRPASSASPALGAQKQHVSVLPASLAPSSRHGDIVIRISSTVDGSKWSTKKKLVSP